MCSIAISAISLACGGEAASLEARRFYIPLQVQTRCASGAFGTVC